MVKIVRTVLRGERGSNPPDLLDSLIAQKRFFASLRMTNKQVSRLKWVPQSEGLGAKESEARERVRSPKQSEALRPK